MTDKKILTMHDHPLQKPEIKKLSKPLMTHDLFKPKPQDPKTFDRPKGPMITTGNIDEIREQAAIKKRMEKARAAKLDKIKEDIKAEKAAEEKKKKSPVEKKAKTEEKSKAAEKKGPESLSEAKTEESKASDKDEKEKKPDALTDAVEAEVEKTGAKKSYSTKKKEEPKEEK